MKYILYARIRRFKEVTKFFKSPRIMVDNHLTIGDTPIFHGSPWSYGRKGTPSTPPEVEGMEPENDGFSKFGFHVKLEGWGGRFYWKHIGRKRRKRFESIS